MPRVMSTGSNFLDPGSRTSVFPLTGWITTVLFGTGVGVGLGVGVGVALGVGVGACCTSATANERVCSLWLPAASVARTQNTYAPGASPEKLSGDAHGL